jgi:hypothetical protein
LNGLHCIILGEFLLKISQSYLNDLIDYVKVQSFTSIKKSASISQGTFFKTYL